MRSGRGRPPPGTGPHDPSSPPAGGNLTDKERFAHAAVEFLRIIYIGGLSGPGGSTDDCESKDSGRPGKTSHASTHHDHPRDGSQRRQPGSIDRVHRHADSVVDFLAPRRLPVRHQTCAQWADGHGTMVTRRMDDRPGRVGEPRDRHAESPKRSHAPVYTRTKIPREDMESPKRSHAPVYTRTKIPREDMESPKRSRTSIRANRNQDETTRARKTKTRATGGPRTLARWAGPTPRSLFPPRKV